MEELIHRIRDSMNGGFPLTPSECEEIISVLEEHKEEDTSHAWDEFISLYPKGTPDGRRKLHVDKANCKKKYEKIVKNNLKLHEKVLTLLKKEIEDRELSGSMNFFPQLRTYINQKRWEAYEGYEDDGKGHNVELL